MDEHTKSIHYLLMADHFMVQKALLSQIKDTELTMGQPKVLDYLKDHDGACQKDIAAGCHIEPASITAVLSGMENKGYIQRSTKSGDRRSLYVYLTDKGREYVEMLNKKFDLVESVALRGFTTEETEELQSLLVRVYDNMKATEKRNVRDEEHEGKNSNVFRWIVYYDYRNCTVGKIQSRCVAGEFHTIYHDLCMGNRDGKGYDHIPCGTCAYTDPITQEAVQADQSASGGRGNRVRIFYNILQLPGYISAEH